MTVNVGKPRQIAYADQVCNDNILINTDYRQGRIVNQRGLTRYTATPWPWVNIFDMHGLVGGTAELLPEGVRITKDADAGYVMLATKVEPYKLEDGKTYCLSMQVDGVVYSTTFAVPLTETQWIGMPHVAGSFGHDTDAGVYNVTYTLYTNDVHPVIQAAKLEQGTVSTLRLEQPDYTETLQKCQYYYYQSWPGDLNNIVTNVDITLNYIVRGEATDINFVFVEVPVAMRSPRTVTIYDLTGAEGMVSKPNWDRTFAHTSTGVVVYRTNGTGIGLADHSATMQKGDICLLFLKISAEL